MTRPCSNADLLAHYAEYHRDQRNIVTHCVGIPMVVFAVGVLLARLHFNFGGMEFTLGWIALALAAAWYLSRRGETTLGLAVSIGIGVLFALAHGVADGSTASWLGWVLSSFFAGILIQLIGHYYEGRAPGPVTNPFALLIGPLFIAAQGLFALGWNRALFEEIERRAGPTHLRDLAHPA